MLLEKLEDHVADNRKLFNDEKRFDFADGRLIMGHYFYGLQVYVNENFVILNMHI